MPTHTLHHQYKILSDFINVPYNGLSSNLIDFTDNLLPYKYYGPDLAAPNNIESYYLVNSLSEKAWGWVHNLDHYWANKYIATSYTDNNNPQTTSQWDDVLEVGEEVDNCNDVPATTIYLDGFLPTTEYAIVLYETYADAATHTGTWLGETTATSDNTGKLPVNVTLGCDSTNGDYGFYIVKNSIAHRNASTENNEAMSFDFLIHPTASRDLFYVKLENDVSNIEMIVNDVLGNKIYRGIISNPVTTINLSDMLPGIYFVEGNSSDGVKIKRIIKL